VWSFGYLAVDGQHPTNAYCSLAFAGIAPETGQAASPGNLPPRSTAVGITACSGRTHLNLTSLVYGTLLYPEDNSSAPT